MASSSVSAEHGVYTPCSNTVFTWKEKQHELGVGTKHYPTAMMLFDRGEPRRCTLGRKGGRGYQEPGYDVWLYFDRDYVIHWLCKVFLARMKGVPSAQLVELFKDALMEARGENGDELQAVRETEGTADDGGRHLLSQST